MTKPRTIKAWGVFTKRGRLCSDAGIWKKKKDADYEMAHFWDIDFNQNAPHTVRRVTITVED